MSVTNLMKKILVIEDESVLRMNLARALRLEKFEAFTAANGREGIELARQQLPDLILCDILMPELNGWRVLEEIRADPATARIPFIFLTAKGDLPDLRAGMNLGADDYLIKPVHLDDLLTAIEARLERVQQCAAADVDFSSAKPLESLGLSSREAEILLLVTRGKVNKEIADALSISTGTVRKHVENIYRKISVPTRNAAALKAVETLIRRAV
jgi:DNA-binding NarL/FixJ family response regulator